MEEVRAICRRLPPNERPLLALSAEQHGHLPERQPEGGGEGRASHSAPAPPRCSQEAAAGATGDDGEGSGQQGSQWPEAWAECTVFPEPVCALFIRLCAAGSLPFKPAATRTHVLLDPPQVWSIWDQLRGCSSAGE